MNVRALAGIGLAATFALAACGSSSPATLTKTEWVSQANAICNDLNTRSNAIRPNSLAELGAALTQISKIADEDLPKISALKPPAEIQADATALITAYGQIDSALKAAAATATDGNPSGAIQAMRTADTQFKPTITAIEGRLGLTDCSK